MIKGIIFDMDGTLTLTEHLHYEAYRQVFARYGITYTWEEERTLYASSGGRYTFTSIFGQHGVQVDIDTCIDEKERVYIDILSHIEPALVPGIVPFLEYLTKHGIPKIVASTTRRDIVALTLERAGLSHFFPVYVSGRDVLHQKPAPDIFLTALKEIGCAPAEAIVFEDAINGVKAARAAGMPCIAVETTAEKENLLEAGAVMVIKDYQDLSSVPLLSGILKGNQ